MVESRTRKREMREYGGNHHQKLGLKRILCTSQFTSTIQQVRVPIRRIIIPIRCLPNPIRHVIPLIPHIHSNPPHHSHHHPTSRSFSSTTQPSSQNTTLSHPSLSLLAMIMSWHRIQHTPSTAYLKYSINPRLIVFPSFTWLGVDPWM